MAEPNITYLFGAGASAQALPTIKGLPERIKHVHDYVQKHYNYDDEETEVNGFKFKLQDAKQLLLDFLNELYETAIQYSTIDTYAKQLHINGQYEEYEKVRFTLSAYFAIDQKISKKDSRYETFLISLLDDYSKLPPNLKFMTWNYDLQMEYAYTKIHQRSDFTSAFRTFLNSGNTNSKEFTSVKLNGTCTYTGRFKDNYSFVKNPLSNKSNNEDIVNMLYYAYTYFKLRRNPNDIIPGIRYSWYCDNENLAAWSNLHSSTTHLVVIGYSFPFFNRDIDRGIIRNMKDLKKIYIQDLYPENIVSRFLSILPDYKSRNIEIITVNNVDEFFLPPEL